MERYKHCPSCNLARSIDHFAKNAAKKDGLASQCKACKKIYQDKWYEKNKATHITNVTIRKKRIATKNRERLGKYLTEHPCVDCGFEDIRALDFDHIRGYKKREVSKLVHEGYPWQTIADEIAKCEVRCANCHRIRHGPVA
jgi:hypothetical protein